MAGLVAARAEDKSFRVTYQSFGPGSGERPAEFVASIDASEGYAAELTASAGTGPQWRLLPPDWDPERWISVVKVQTGQQCDFFAFMFSDQNATVSYAGHRPSRIREVQYWYAVPPGPDQIPLNAIRECATDWLAARRHPPVQTGPTVRIVVKAWEEEAKEVNLLDIGGAGAMVAAPPASMDGLEVIAFAAAHSAGWQPTAATDTTDNITMEFQERVSLYYAVRIRAAWQGHKATLTLENIPKEAIYPSLHRALETLHPKAPARGFGYLGSHHASLLAWSQAGAYIAEGDTVTLFPPASGVAAWTYDAKAQGKARFAALAPAGETRICRYDRDISLLDPGTGELRLLAPVACDDPDSFALPSEQGAVILADGALKYFDQGEPAWTFDSSRCLPPVSAAEGRAFMADDTHVLHALDLTHRRVLWSAPVPDTPALLTPLGGVLIVVTAGNTIGFSAASGEELWRLANDDRLVSPPQRVGDSVLLADKKNVIRLVSAQSGKLVAETRWPTWLRAVRAATAQNAAAVACLDLRNAVTFLSAADLSVVSRHQFRTSLRPSLCVAEGSPLQWKYQRHEAAGGLLDLSADMAASAPSVLCEDTLGFVYVLPLPGATDTTQ